MVERRVGNGHFNDFTRGVCKARSLIRFELLYNSVVFVHASTQQGRQMHWPLVLVVLERCKENASARFGGSKVFGQNGWSFFLSSLTFWARRGVSLAASASTYVRECDQPNQSPWTTKAPPLDLFPWSQVYYYYCCVGHAHCKRLQLTSSRPVQWCAGVLVCW